MKIRSFVVAVVLLQVFTFSRTAVYAQEIVDTITQRNGMHACPDTQSMTGIRLDRNELLCSNVFGSYTSSQEVVDGDDEPATVRNDMHACPDGMAMTGVHEGNNWLSCAPVPGGFQSVIVDGDDEPVTVRNDMHACPDGMVMVGLHAGSNYVLCGEPSIGISTQPQTAAESNTLETIWVIHTTSPEDNTGTDDDFELIIQSEGQMATFRFPDLDYDDRTSGQADQYSFDLSNFQFHDNQIGPGDIRLRTLGSEYWVMQSIFVIGENSNGEFKLLVARPNWPRHAIFSQDANEGLSEWRLDTE
jgi:hypothetical protein